MSSVKIFRFIFVLTAAVALLAGCSMSKKEGKTFEAMGPNAPEFGSAGKADLATFIVGDWCFVDSLGEPQPGRWYSFKSGGALEFGGAKGEYTGTGTWQVSGNYIQVTYDTVKGKPLDAFKAEVKADEEKGGQIAIDRALFYDGLFGEWNKQTMLWVDTDKRRMSFHDTSNTPPPGGQDPGEVSDIMGLDKSGLERAEAAKE